MHLLPSAAMISRTLHGCISPGFGSWHGLSSYVWGYQHVIGHHTHPNHDSLDPDVATKKIDFWRIKPYQEWSPYYRYHMPLLFTILSIKMKIQDFHTMFILKKANVPIIPINLKELFIFKIAHVCYRIILPYPYTSLFSLLLLNLLLEFVMGFSLELLPKSVM